MLSPPSPGEDSRGKCLWSSRPRKCEESPPPPLEDKGRGLSSLLCLDEDNVLSYRLRRGRRRQVYLVLSLSLPIEDSLLFPLAEKIKGQSLGCVPQRTTLAIISLLLSGSGSQRARLSPSLFARGARGPSSRLTSSRGER